MLRSTVSLQTRAPILEKGSSMLTTSQYIKPQTFRAALFLVSGVIASAGTSAHARVDFCFGDWEPAAYAMGTLNELGYPRATASECTIGGRTGYAIMSFANREGDQTAYVFLCNADGSGCGVDGDPNIQCMAEAQTRDRSEGTLLDDGERGFTARNPSIGEEMGDVPMDENANYISRVYRIRVVCRHHT